MRRAFIGRRAAGDRSHSPNVNVTSARRCHGAFKSETQRTRVKTWAERKRFGSGHVFTVRALWKDGAAAMYIEERVNEYWHVWGKPWRFKRLRHTNGRPSKTQIMPRVNVWNHSWKKHDLTLEKKLFTHKYLVNITDSYISK